MASGLTLRPIPDAISVFDLAASGAVGFREWAVLEPLLPVATGEIESAGDAESDEGYDTLNRAWLLTALLVLKGFSHLTAPACSSYSWARVAGHQKRSSGTLREPSLSEDVEAAANPPDRSLPPFTGGLLDYHLRLLTGSHSRIDALNGNDAEWLRDHFPIFNRLAHEDESFRFALEAAVDWRYSRDLRTAIARIWSGIEAIFGVSSELVYRISLLSAAVLEARGDARRERFRSVKKLYSVRSKAVHGGRISIKKLKAGLDDSAQLLADLLLVIVARGAPFTTDDLEVALLG